jgi:hypothetical protein
LGDQFQGHRAALRFTDDLYAWVLRQQAAKTLAHDGVIIDYKNTRIHARSTVLSSLM